MIHLEEDATTSREAYWWLKLVLKEVVREEIRKLLERDIIHAISDSKWVTLDHILPKKYGVTIIKKEYQEITTWIPTKWRDCIHYRCLNLVICKGHFPILFIDQVLEPLTGYSYYCYLNGYSRFN